MLNSVTHDPTSWKVEFLEEKQVTAIKYVPGIFTASEAAKNFAREIFEETSMTECEILRFSVSRTSTDEQFVIDVACQPTYFCDTFFVREENGREQRTYFEPPSMMRDSSEVQYAR